MIEDVRLVSFVLNLNRVHQKVDATSLQEREDGGIYVSEKIVCNIKLTSGTRSDKSGLTIDTLPEWQAKNQAKDSIEMRKARRRDYWIILEMAGLLINWDPRYFIPHVMYTSVMFLNYSYIGLCLLMSSMKSPDLITMCQFLNLLGLVMFPMLVSVIFLSKQESFIKLTSIGAKELFDYGSSFSRADEIRGWYKMGDKLKKVMFTVLPPWLGFVALSIMLSDLVDGAFSYPKTNETIINGLHQTLPLKMYCFHPINNEFVRWLTICSQAACAGGTALVIGSADLVMFFGGQHIVIQLKILNTAILDIDNRAAKLYESELGLKPPSSPLDKTEDRQLMGYYKFCLKQNVEHHKEILSFAELYHGLINWPCGLVVVNGSIVVAMSMLSIMQGGGQPSVLLTSFLLVVAEVASILMVCEVGQTIRNLCEELFYSMYSFEWMDCSQDTKRMIHIMKFRMMKPIVLTAGSLTPIDRNTFSSMMNTAYSYMNLVLASGSDEAK